MDIYNDNFIEYLIKKKKGAKEYLIIVGLIAAGVVFSVAMLALMFFLMATGRDGGMGTSIGLVLIALAWYLIYLLGSTFNVEYEYILTNSAMDIDKVMSKKGRKHMVEWDFKNIEICARADDADHRYEYENKQSRDKIYDFTGDSKVGSVYFVDYTDEKGVKTRVLFQPTSKIVETAAKYNRSRVFI